MYHNFHHHHQQLDSPGWTLAFSRRLYQSFLLRATAFQSFTPVYHNFATNKIRGPSHAGLEISRQSRAFDVPIHREEKQSSILNNNSRSILHEEIGLVFDIKISKISWNEYHNCKRKFPGYKLSKKLIKIKWITARQLLRL